MADASLPLIRAAQYVRMSTEKQTYSIEYQSVAIAAYALEHRYELVGSYVDAGVSGVSERGRDGLKRLLSDVIGGLADFSVILVFDVSRWGRFQDPDQGAHYEYICRDAGVAVEYCAEAFTNDGSVASSLIKSLKRVMAAEFSRELSEKISRAQRGLGAKGYWQGGPPGFGLRRIALRPSGHVTMEYGERNAIQGARVAVGLGPSAEVEIIREIYRRFLSGLSPKRIADQLNLEGSPSSTGRPWTRTAVTTVLRSEKYAGTLLFGRSHRRLSQKRLIPRSDWIRVPEALEPIVSRAIFDVAQKQFRVRRPNATEEEMLQTLRAVFLEKGRLSFKIVQSDPRTHCPSSYVRRFGSLQAAFERVGYTFNKKQRLAAERIRWARPDQYRVRTGIAPLEGE